MRLTDEKRSEILYLYEEGASWADIHKRTGVSTRTIMKALYAAGHLGEKKRERGGKNKTICITISEDCAAWLERSRNKSMTVQQLIEREMRAGAFVPQEQKMPYSEIEGLKDDAESGIAPEEDSESGVRITANFCHNGEVVATRDLISYADDEELVKIQLVTMARMDKGIGEIDQIMAYKDGNLEYIFPV